MQRIKDIGGIGDEFLGFALIRKSTLGVASNGEKFLTLELVDNDSHIEAKKWKCTEDDPLIFCNEALIKVKGVVKEYKGQKQLNVEKIRLVIEQDGVNIGEFIPRAPEETNDLVNELENILSTVQKPILKEITGRLYAKHKEKYITHPAASHNHHNYYSGLLFHVVSMLRQGLSLSKQYPLLDRDLIISGIFCHDIGKLEELSNPISPSYTNKRLLGHIAIGVLWIDREVQLLKTEGRVLSEEEENLVDQLMHIVLSHHGDVSLGWGSTVSPMILEAKIVHQIDKTDADHEMIRAGLENKEEGEFHKIWPAGNFLKK